jgi:hypothetical protein
MCIFYAQSNNPVVILRLCQMKDHFSSFISAANLSFAQVAGRGPDDESLLSSHYDRCVDD